MSITDPAYHASSNGSQETHATLGSRFVHWLKQPARLLNRRSHHRLADPPLRAYLGMIGSTPPFPVSSISSTGFFMVTDEPWQPGTCLPLRLERTDRPGFAAISQMAVQTCVARKGNKGVGFLFLPINEPGEQQELGNHSNGPWGGTRWADQKAIDEMLAELGTEKSRGREPN